MKSVPARPSPEKISEPWPGSPIGLAPSRARAVQAKPPGQAGPGLGPAIPDPRADRQRIPKGSAHSVGAASMPNQEAKRLEGGKVTHISAT